MSKLTNPEAFLATTQDSCCAKYPSPDYVATNLLMSSVRKTRWNTLFARSSPIVVIFKSVSSSFVSMVDNFFGVKCARSILELL